MHIVLFIIYALLLGYGIFRLPFLRNSGIRPGWLLFLFALHVTVGCLHNIIAYRYYPGHGDIWDFFQRSFLTRHRLLSSDFAKVLSDNSSWNYLTHNGIVWVQVFLNILSFDNLYINTLLFSFPLFLGNIALFRVFRKRFPGDPLTALTTLLLPSTLFWTACIHREGAAYALLGFLFYYADRLLVPPAQHLFAQHLSPQHRPPHPGGNRRLALFCFFLFLAVVYFRPAVALSLFPALVIGWWVETAPSRRLLLTITAIVAGAGIALTLFIPGGLPHYILQAISDRQQEFRVLEGHSRLALPALDGSWGSLWRALPAALRNGLFEPLPGSGGQRIYWAFSLELLGIWAVIVLAGSYWLLSRKRPGSLHSFTAACLLFAFTGLLMIGLMVPFAGAIIRYRSIFLPFLLAPFLHSLHSTQIIKKLNKLLSISLFRQHRL